MALHAVGRGGWCVGVDVGYGRHHREVGIGMAAAADRTGGRRDVVGRLGGRGEVAKACVAVRAVTGCGVFAVGNKEGACYCLWSGLEAFERCRCGDRVLAHAHPHVVALVAVRAAARNAGMDHRLGRCRCEETATRCALGCNAWYQAARGCAQVAALAFGGAGQVCVGTDR